MKLKALYFRWAKEKRRNLTKTLLVMKLTMILLTAAALQVSAKGTSQTVTFVGKDVPLERVFSVIKQQTGYVVAYDYGMLSGTKPVSLSAKDLPLQDFLNQALHGQSLDFIIKKKTIFIKKLPVVNKNNNTTAVVGSSDQQLQLIDIKGHITNEKGEPLAGANIVVKRTGKGTIADAKGNFSLLNVNNSDIIIISFVGYLPQSITVGDKTNFSLVLNEADNELDQVVMQAYGQTTKRLNTGNIAKITSEEISKQPLINPLQALQGRVPGLTITQTSGYASAPFKVEIRGRTNLNYNFPSEPLYIIDGVPLTVLEISGANYASGPRGFLQNGLPNPAGGQSPFYSVNPADIESIEILKDADATAIYGSRGANGVILITTKKGKAGKSKFSASVYQGISKVTKYWEMLNTQEYLQVRREAFKNDNTTMTTANAYDILVWDTTRYTDWQKYLWGGTGKTSDAQLNFSGGDSRTSFRLGAGYHQQSDITAVNGADKRGSASFNLIHRVLNDRLNISFTASYSFAKLNMIVMPNAASLAPNAPNVYDSSGKPNYFGWIPVRSTYPFTSLFQPYYSKTDNLISSITVGYQVFKGLVVKTNLGYTSTHINQQFLFPKASKDPLNNPTGSAYFGSNNIRNIIVEPQIEYNTVIGKGKLNVLIGTSTQANTTEGLYTSAEGYQDDALLNSPTSAQTSRTTGNKGEYKYSALFGRINYNWKNKYLINLSARRDGSSRFGEGKQFGNFGALGAAWIFTEEAMIQENLTFLSFGKLRGSYGYTGSDNIGDYKYLTRWSGSPLVPNYGGYTSLLPLQHANPDYQWQLNKKLEIGIDLGLLKDRVSFGASWYRNRCNNQLLDFPLPAYTGFVTVVANSPALVENTGWEFNINSKVFNRISFKWSISGNIGTNKNKLISFPDFEKSPYYGTYEIGKSLYIRKLLKFTGVDPQTGRYTFEDKNKDGSIDRSFGPKDDLYDYDLNPKFSGGIGNNITFKNWSLSFFFNFVKQIGKNALLTSNYPGMIANSPVEILDRWRKQGDNTNIARFTTVGHVTDGNFHIYSDGVYTDASFIRLQNLSISYNFPKNILKPTGMQSCNLFFHGQNLFVITNYKGLDPETQNFGGMPPARIFTAGVQFNY